MGQDKPPQYSDPTSSSQYTPKFSPEQKSFLELAHRFAAVKPLSLKIFLDLVSEDDDLFSKHFPATFKDFIGAEIDGMLTNPTFKQLLSAHLLRQDHSAALISIMTLLVVSSSSPEFGDSQQGGSIHQGLSPPTPAVPTGQERLPLDPDNDSQTEDRFAAKFSPEQKSFLDLAYHFAAVKPLSLKIFLDLVSEDEEMLSKEFPDRSKESTSEEIEDMLTNPTFKPLLSAQLAKQDYPAALISMTTLITISTPSVGVGRRRPTIRPEQPKEGPSSMSILDRAQHLAAADILDIRIFLDLVANDDDLLSKTFPERSRESVMADLSRLSSNPSFQRELHTHLERQDFLAALLSTIALFSPTPFSPKVNLGAPQYGTPLEQMSDSYSKGLYHLYDLLWNQQESITTSHTVMVPNLPYGYINFEQPAPTAILPPSFGTQPQPYSCDILKLSDHSEAILPSNNKQLKKILIRTCYRDIYKELELDGHHAAILGQPGVGKSCFLTYILAERLRKQQPTILQLDEDDVYSFSRFGAMRFPAKSNPDETLLLNAWFLVDCSEHKPSIPNIPSSAYRVPSLKVVYAVSPRNSRRVTWCGQLVAKELWIYTHSWDELYVIGCTEPKELDVSDDKLAFSFLKYGTNPRICMPTATSPAHDATQLKHIQDELTRRSWAVFPDVSADLPTPLHTAIASLDKSFLHTVVPSSPYLAERINMHRKRSGYVLSHFTDFKPCWAAVISIPQMFQMWAPYRLSAEAHQYKAVLPQVPTTSRLNWYHTETVKFADVKYLESVCNENSFAHKLFVPDACAFPVEAVMYDYKNKSYWLILFTAGADRVVDANALGELLPICPYGQGYQHYWKFLLVVPEPCDSVENISVDIQGAEPADDRFEKIPRYVLRL